MTAPLAETSSGRRVVRTSPRVSPRLRRVASWSVEPVVVVVASCVMFVLGYGGLANLLKPQGAGDLLPPYVAAHLWALGTPFRTSHWGFPLGMDQRYYPTADVLQNATAGLLGRLSDNPFFGINAMWALSFPATALAAWWVVRLTGLRGPMAVFFSLAITFVPYHWLRIAHVYLGTMYSAVLGVGLAMLIGSGWVERAWRSPRGSRWALAGVGGIAVVIGLSGIYYVCFTAILCGVALGYRLVRGASLRGLFVSATPMVLAVCVLALALAPSWLYVRGHPPLAPIAERQPIESVLYSGMFSQLLLPSTHSWIPLGPLDDLVTRANTTGAGVTDAGVLWDADAGSLITLLGAAMLLVGGVVLARRRHTSGHEATSDAEEPVGLGFLSAMLASSFLFFVPWGLNYVFALVVTPQIRGWDRLTPVLQTLELAMVALLWRQLGLWTRGVKAAAVAALLSVVVLFDTVLPFRSFYQTTSAAGAVERDAGNVYAARLNQAIPADCGVLQLPFIPYPESGGREGLADYSLFMPGLTNSDKSWSFGAVVNTVSAEWQARLDNTLTRSDVDLLGSAGFCAVHVDSRGFTPEEYTALTGRLKSLLGKPVATGFDGAWTAYEIPPGKVASGGLDPEALTSEQRAFFYPSGETGP
jgi:hypothetical protein